MNSFKLLLGLSPEITVEELGYRLAGIVAESGLYEGALYLYNSIGSRDSREIDFSPLRSEVGPDRGSYHRLGKMKHLPPRFLSVSLAFDMKSRWPLTPWKEVAVCAWKDSTFQRTSERCDEGGCSCTE